MVEVGISRRGGFVTRPARRQEVQTFSRFDVPSTRARTRWIFGSQRRLVRRWEWLKFIPNEGFFPQSSQTAAMMNRSSWKLGSHLESTGQR